MYSTFALLVLTIQPLSQWKRHFFFLPFLLPELFKFLWQTKYPWTIIKTSWNRTSWLYQLQLYFYLPFGMVGIFLPMHSLGPLSAAWKFMLTISRPVSISSTYATWPWSFQISYPSLLPAPAYTDAKYWLHSALTRVFLVIYGVSSVISRR